MDTGKGNFERPNFDAEKKDIEDMYKAMMEKHPNHGGWFQVGEIIEIRGSHFRVKSIKPDELRLKLLPRK
jgi:uncharacterized Zn finger protein